MSSGVTVKNYLSNWCILLSVLIITASGLMALVSGSEVYNVAVLNDTGFYPFGSEGPVAGIWQYENKENYIAFNLMTVFMYIITSLIVIVGLSRKNNIILKYSIITFLSTFLILHIIQENYFRVW